VTAPGGGAIYVGGRETNASGHYYTATIAYRAATGHRLWAGRAGGGQPDIAVTPDGQKVIVSASRNKEQDAITSYRASTGQTLWTRLAPGSLELPSGLFISPDGDTMFIGGSRVVAYSVADGTVSWQTGLIPGSSSIGSSLIGLTGGGTRLFETTGSSCCIATAAYQG
jgi:outer membrane protein assembly factor BamB